MTKPCFDAGQRDCYPNIELVTRITTTRIARMRNCTTHMRGRSEWIDPVRKTQKPIVHFRMFSSKSRTPCANGL